MKYWKVAADALEKYIGCGENLRTAIESHRYREAIELFRQRDAEFLNYRAYVHLAQKLSHDDPPPHTYTSLIEQAADQNESLRALCERFVQGLSDDQRRVVKMHQNQRSQTEPDQIGHFSKVVN